MPIICFIWLLFPRHMPIKFPENCCKHSLKYNTVQQYLGHDLGGGVSLQFLKILSSQLVNQKEFQVVVQTHNFSVGTMQKTHVLLVKNA